MAVSLASIEAAAQRIKGLVSETPVMTSRSMDQLSGNNLFFKCELFQRTGAFKFRGACNALLQLDPQSAKRGVVTHSSGNHGQALSLASSLHQIPCVVVMPQGSPNCKVEAVKGYGGEIIFVSDDPVEREVVAAKLAKEKGMTLIPSSNHYHIMEGQGTMMLEFARQVPSPLDYLIVPVGGGGMLGGVAVASKGLNPSTVVIGAEPILAGDAALSLAEGKRHAPLSTTSETVADGLRTGLGSLTFPILQENVSEIITVTEHQIKQGMRLIWERMKLVVEPSAGTGVAVALSPQFKEIAGENKNVGVVLCGGNLDLEAWHW